MIDIFVLVQKSQPLDAHLPTEKTTQYSKHKKYSIMKLHFKTKEFYLDIEDGHYKGIYRVFDDTIV